MHTYIYGIAGECVRLTGLAFTTNKHWYPFCDNVIYHRQRKKEEGHEEGKKKNLQLCAKFCPQLRMTGTRLQLSLFLKAASPTKRDENKSSKIIRWVERFPNRKKDSSWFGSLFYRLFNMMRRTRFLGKEGWCSLITIFKNATTRMNWTRKFGSDLD